MEAAHIVPDGRALQTIAWAAARGGEYAQSLATLRRLRSSDGQPLSPAEFLGVGLSICETIEATFELLRAAREDGVIVDPFTFYTAVLQGWAAGASAAPAVAAASLLRGLADGALPMHSDLRAFNLLADAVASDGSDEEHFMDFFFFTASAEAAPAGSVTAAVSGREASWAAANAVGGFDHEEVEADDEADDEEDEHEVQEEALVRMGKEESADETDDEAEMIESMDGDLDEDDEDDELDVDDDEDDEVEMEQLLPPGYAEALLDEAYNAAVAAGQLSPWAAEETVDLHGYSVALAGAAMRHVLAKLGREHAEREALCEVDGGRCTDGLVVITGRGLGSGTSGPLLGPAVLAMLESDFEPPITARVVDGNEGRLLVNGGSLQVWLAANAQEE